MSIILKKVAVFLMYVGTKAEKRDTTAANTGLVWYGNGFVNLVDEEAALALVRHPDVWAPVARDGIEIPARVQAAYNAAFHKLYGRPPAAATSFAEGEIKGAFIADPARLAGGLSLLQTPAPSEPETPEPPEDLNFDDEDLNMESQQPVDAESPRMQAIRTVLMSLDVTKPQNRNPDFFNQDGSPKVMKIRELMGDSGVTKEEVQEAFEGIMAEITPV